MEEKKTIESLMNEQRVFPAPPEFVERAWVKTREERDKLYQESVDDLEGFWARIAEEYITWFKKWDRVLDYSFTDRIYVKWFEGGKLNASYNCIDRHLDTWRRNKAAIVWEGDDGSVKTYTYQQLFYEVNNFARVLKKFGIKKGDRVAIYLPMIPELPIAMLACARIGAIHSVVFGGFSAQSLRDRINDSECKMLITADEGIRGGRYVPLKANSDEALLECPSVETVIVVQRSAGNVDMEPGRDYWWHEEMAALESFEVVEPEWMDAEDPLFILYTSGSTGKPKGVVHTTGGYLVYASFTHKLIFDYHDEDVYFCTADIGWVTGHSYIVYGPLANGATSLMFEGVPNYPKPDRFWQIVEKHGVTQLYTAPTAIRALMKEGPQWADMHEMPSLKLLGTVGEPINPEAWIWYYKHVGKERCPIVDTWWQTETGGILISPLPAAVPQKPGSATLPMPGVFPEVVREDGSPADVNEGGYLCINKPWPGILRARGVTPKTTVSRRSTSAGSLAVTSQATARASTRMAISGSWVASTTSSTFLATASAPPRSRARLCPTRLSPKLPLSGSRTRSRAKAFTRMSSSRMATSRAKNCARFSKVTCGRSSGRSPSPTSSSSSPGSRRHAAARSCDAFFGRLPLAT
jgi:acetyl-CoA synthetase